MILKHLENHVNSLDTLGFSVVPSEHMGVDIRKLSKQLADFTDQCQFSSLIDNGVRGGAANLLEYVDTAYRAEQNNELTSRLYQFLPTIPEVHQFACSAGLVESLRRFGVDQPTLGTVPLIRIDRPHETTRATPWHQDYWFSFSSLNSVVLWMPMGDLTPDMGLLRVIPSSHKDGVLPFSDYKEGREPFRPYHDVAEKDAIEVEVPFGSILCFRQCLLHKSGNNLSDRCRVSMQLRYNRMLGQAEPFTTFTAKHSEYVTGSQMGYKR